MEPQNTHGERLDAQNEHSNAFARRLPALLAGATAPSAETPGVDLVTMAERCAALTQSAARVVSASVEDPDAILEKILTWAKGDRRITAVILTGSRGRGERVDAFSDLDVELIGPSPHELAADDTWIDHIGPHLLVLPFDEPELTTRLVVLPAGRKVDFSIWPESRLTRMAQAGLNELYDRGYTVQLDKTGLSAGLPRATRIPRLPDPPDQPTFTRLEGEFWFEATQVAVYLLRSDLWVAKMREHTMHTCLLTMLEWQAQSDPAGARFTWHIGHHIDEWLSADDHATAGQVFTRFDVPDTVRGLTAAMALFATATQRAAANLSLEHRPELAEAARTHVCSLLNQHRAESATP